MNQWQTILVILPLFLTGCCAPPLEVDQIEQVHKGMTPAQIQRLAGQKPQKQTQLIDQNQHYLIQSYRMKANVQASTTNFCDKAGCHIRPVQTSSSDYLFIYKKNGTYRLEQWGFKKDLPASSNALLRQTSG